MFFDIKKKNKMVGLFSARDVYHFEIHNTVISHCSVSIWRPSLTYLISGMQLRSKFSRREIELQLHLPIGPLLSSAKQTTSVHHELKASTFISQILHLDQTRQLQ